MNWQISFNSLYALVFVNKIIPFNRLEISVSILFSLQLYEFTSLLSSSTIWLFFSSHTFQSAGLQIRIHRPLEVHACKLLSKIVHMLQAVQYLLWYPLKSSVLGEEEKVVLTFICFSHLYNHINYSYWLDFYRPFWGSYLYRLFNLLFYF